MKIVIDIPEEYYNLLKGFDDEKCSVDMLLLKNGAPLPKGHGKLIDADVLRKDLIANEWITDDDGGGLEDILDNSPTIVEADKVESEDKA